MGMNIFQRLRRLFKPTLSDEIAADLRREDNSTISSMVSEILLLKKETGLLLPDYGSLVVLRVRVADGTMLADDAIRMMVQQVELCELKPEPTAFGMTTFEQKTIEQIEALRSQALLNMRRLNAMRDFHSRQTERVLSDRF